MKGIITLCGSTRYFDHFRQANLKLTCADWIVLSIGIDTKSDKQLHEAGMQVDKVQLDRLHKEKIAMSQAIMVIDVDGYIGDATRSEIEYAMKNGKALYSYANTKDFSEPEEFDAQLLNCSWCSKPIIPANGGFCNDDCKEHYFNNLKAQTKLTDYK